MSDDSIIEYRVSVVEPMSKETRMFDGKCHTLEQMIKEVHSFINGGREFITITIKSQTPPKPMAHVIPFRKKKA